jgi:hypothetical protein
MRSASHAIGILSVLFISVVAGCGQSLVPGDGNANGNGNGNGNGGAANIGLPLSVGRFVVTAGEEKQSKAILPATQVADDGSVTLILDPGNITFTSESGTAGSMLVSAAFGAVPGFDTACANPIDSYGPFTVSVDANSQITGVNGAFEVAQSTVDLVSGGSYTICVTFSSTIAGTVIIESLTME